MAEAVPAAAAGLDSIPSLQHHTTLHSPTPNVRTWSSAPHPSPHTPLLATATSDKAVYIWDTREWKLLSTIAGGHKRSVRCVGWKDYGEQSRAAKRRRIITSTGNGADEGQEGRKVNPVVLATGSFDSNCGLWVWNRDRSAGDDGLGGSEMVNSTSGGSIPGAFGGSGFDNGDDEDELDFTNAAREGDENEEEEEWHFSTLLTGPDSEIKDLAFAPPHYGANLLATCSRDKSVWVWEEVEPEEWETVAVLSEHTGDVKCLTWLKGVVGLTKGDIRRRLRARRQNDGMEIDEGGGSQDKQADDEEEIVLGGRELLASGSYDDTIRLHHDDEAEGDWLTIAVLTGHDGTVWDLKFEPYLNLAAYPQDTTENEVIADWSPRLISCSDDLTIRVWRKQLNEKEREDRRNRILDARRGNVGDSSNGPETAAGESGNIMQTGFAGTRIPSVIRPPTSTERWIEEAQFPAVHVRSIYSIDWSAQTGLVVSCGGDGIIAVFKEVAVPPKATGEDVQMNGTDELPQDQSQTQEGEIEKRPTEWKVVAMMEAAHDEYEINHVCWAPRRDLRRRQHHHQLELEDNGNHVATDQKEDEEDREYIISTGDDGQVRVWTLPEEVLLDVRRET